MTRVVRKQSITMVLGVLGLVVAGAALVWLASSARQTEPENLPPARIAKVTTKVLRPQPWKESFRTFGVVRPLEEVDIAIDFAATVRKVHFEEDQRVEAGAVLIEFDPGKRQLKLEQADAVVEDAKVRLTKARQDMERATTLHRRDVITNEEFQQSQTNLNSAEAQLAEALAARRLAQREVDENVLRSPASGLVASRSVEPGETVMPGKTLGTVQVVDMVRVVTYVSERDINSLRVGAEAAVTSAGVRGRRYEARIESIGTTADPQTGNFPVKITVQNENGLLRDGMTARVRLEGIPVSDALLVPRTALADRNRRRVVYKVVDGKAVETEPVLVLTLGESYLVLDGLAADDEIILDGHAGIIDGSPVETVSGGGA